MSEPAERAPMAHAPISIVLPICHEDPGLEAVVRCWVNYLDSLAREYEVLLVDDGSGDRTGVLAEELTGRVPRLKVIHHPRKLGIGAALRTGLTAACFPLFFYAEGSSAYQPQDLGKLLEFMDHVDLVTGYREWLRNLPGWSWREWFSRLVLRFVFGLRLKDVDCAFKLFRRSLFAHIPIQSDGLFVHAEILAKANFLGCMMAEIGVNYAPLADTAPDTAARRQRRREAFRLFRHPEFGPAVLPE